MIYYSLGHSVLTYGILAWRSASCNIINPIFILQKKIVHVVSGSSWFAQTSPIFKESRILNLQDLYKFQILSFMYRILHMNHMPKIGDQIISNNINISHDMTRNKNFRLLILIKTITQRSFYFYGPKL